MSFTEEQFKKAVACTSAEELLALAKAEGFAFTKEEAEKFFTELQGKEVSLDDVKSIAGGVCAGEVCGANC